MAVPDADTTERTFTLSEYEQLSEEAGYREELVEGRLVREPLGDRSLHDTTTG